jgi:hypothetical protein
LRIVERLHFRLELINLNNALLEFLDYSVVTTTE